MCNSFSSQFMLFLFISSLFLTTTTVVSEKVQLIHVDAPSSPYRTIYDSAEHREATWTNRSVSRLKDIHLIDMAANDIQPSSFYNSRLSRDPTGVFLAKLGVGTDPQTGAPAKEQFLVIDTGSPVVWVTCLVPHAYNFVHSSTYKKVLCSDPQCEPFQPPPYPRPLEACTFQTKYVSSAGPIRGIIIKDYMTFSDDGISAAALFGCVKLDSPLHKSLRATGVMGLSIRQGSMAYQFGRVFSYCVGDVNDSDNVLLLTRRHAKLIGHFTPILFENSPHVYVNLTGISVGRKVLDIPPRVFRRHGYSGGTIIDTGTAKTFLADEAYNVLLNEMLDIMEPEDPAHFCFWGFNLPTVPVVKLIFEGGATLKLKPDALFGPPYLKFFERCFDGVKRASEAGETLRHYTVIGMNDQKHYNMGYDYKYAKVYMQEVEHCGELAA